MTFLKKFGGQEARKQTILTHLSLFSGIGGLDRVAEWLGLKPPEIRALKRWCNNKRIFKTVFRFKDYAGGARKWI